MHTLQERPQWHWYLQGFLSSQANAIIAPSWSVIRKLEAYGPVPCPTVIPNGIDVARFERAEAIPKSERPWPADAWVVGYVGRFDPVKRLPLLIRAVKELMRREPALRQRMHLALVGYGPAESELRRLASDELGLQGRVHFPGLDEVFRSDADEEFRCFLFAFGGGGIWIDARSKRVRLGCLWWHVLRRGWWNHWRRRFGFQQSQRLRMWLGLWNGHGKDRERCYKGWWDIGLANKE